MSSSMKRVTAWFSSEEREAVYQELFSNDPAKQKHAVARIAVWKSRIQHRLSSGIECTSQLMSALIQDRDLQQNVSSAENEQQIRLSYAMALVRFVNHLTESGHNRNIQAVHVLAEELGLPLWLVELRHDATHASLPSLPLLRSATQYALAWIKREYWDAVLYDDDSDEECPSHTPIEKMKMYQEQLSDKFIIFMQEQFNASSDATDKRVVKAVTNDIRGLVLKCRERSALLLAGEGYLVLTKDQLQALNIDIETLTKPDDLLLPTTIVTFWEPVISLYQSVGLLPQVLINLAQDLSDKGTLRDRLRAGWIATIISAFTKPVTGLKIKNTADDIDALRLLEVCLQNPNMYTSKLITCIFSELQLPLSNEQKHKLVSLLQCFGTAENPKEKPTTKHHVGIYTLDTLLRLPADDQSSIRSSGERNWQLAEELIDWASYPMGACPHVSLTVNSLELDSSLDNLISAKESCSLDNLISAKESCSEKDMEYSASASPEESSPLRTSEVSADVTKCTQEMAENQLDAAEINKNIALF